MNQAQLVTTQLIGFLQNVRRSLEESQLVGTQTVITKLNELDAELAIVDANVDLLLLNVAEVLSEVLLTKGIAQEARDNALAAKFTAEQALAAIQIVDGKVDIVLVDTMNIKDKVDAIDFKIDAIDLELDGKANTTDVFDARDAVLAEVAVAIAEAIKAQPSIGEIKAFGGVLPSAYEMVSGVSQAIVDLFGTVQVTKRVDLNSTRISQIIADTLTNKIVNFDIERPYRFDPSSLLKTAGATYPLPLSGNNTGYEIGKLGKGDGFVYFVGGTFATGLLGSTVRRADTYRYDINADTYTRVADAPTTQQVLASAWSPVNGKFYYVALNSNNIFSYDPVANVHATLAAVLPSSPYFKVGMTTLPSGEIIITGRFNGANGPDYVLRLNVNQTLTILSTVAGFNLTSTHSVLGADGLVHIFTSFDFVLTYDPVTNTINATNYVVPYNIGTFQKNAAVAHFDVGQPAYVLDSGLWSVYFPSTFSVTAQTVVWGKYVGI